MSLSLLGRKNAQETEACLEMINFHCKGFLTDLQMNVTVSVLKVLLLYISQNGLLRRKKNNMVNKVRKSDSEHSSVTNLLHSHQIVTLVY